MSSRTEWDIWPEVCSSCGRSWSLPDRRWECACGGLLDLVGPLADPFAARVAGGGDRGGSPMVRYGAVLPPGAASLDLGMAATPVSEVGPGLFVKAEHRQPTGSFKDRGAAVMIGVARRLGVRSVVVDSSGNAGRSVAAHAARAGLGCTVYVPSGTDTAKVRRVAGHGARVVEVAGGRAAAARAAQEDVGASGRWYASHVHQPLFHHGVKTLAYELYEQVPGLSPVASIVVPAGNGTLVLGLWLGFGELVALGRLERRPRLVAVQAERCAPLTGRAPAAGDPPTAASGIAVPEPPRAAQVRAAVTASGGRILTVAEDGIADARSELRRLGFDVEPTGAVAWAALSARRPADGPVVAVLTGG